MPVKLVTQNTPNPNALKFVLDTAVKSQGTATYKSANDAKENLLAKAIFDANKSIRELYFNDNYITVTQDGTATWIELEEKIRAVILNNISKHNPNFNDPKKETVACCACNKTESCDELSQINEILNQTIRPALQRDGGDLQVIDFKENILTINYQGACGSCPHAAMGTLQAIENILRTQFNPDILVKMG